MAPNEGPVYTVVMREAMDEGATRAEAQEALVIVDALSGEVLYPVQSTGDEP
ncbi:MAG: hypothetical protein GX100_00965 [candidate division WS1 bacterium]|jgi:hypothetical protein|nr:hypothetical protein [candidate division WS1 bacterium]